MHCIKTELNQLGIKPKKSLGQNFLTNEGVYRKIVAALEIKPDDTILEVGPGLGTLTEYLAASGARIIAVEKDRKLVEYLKTKFTNNNRVTILEGDVLKFDIRHSTFDIRDYKVVGNIPYYLTSHLLRIIFEDWPRPELVVLTIQKEVAQRICASPPHPLTTGAEGARRSKSSVGVGASRRRMSLLAVSVQYYAEPKIVSYVSKNSFWPSPEVDSAILRLGPRDYRLGQEKTTNYKLQTKNFFRVVRAGFAGKRKQLANNLARELGMPKGEVEEKLKSVGIDPKRRAETLAIKEWESIATMFLPH